jgi:glycosyltransferase involved in cell wall biosynthesis
MGTAQEGLRPERSIVLKIVFTNDMVYRYALGDPSAIGGAERYQWLLARALAAAGWSVTVGVREPMKGGERRAIDGVNFVGIGQNRSFLAWYRFLVAERPQWWYWQCASHQWGPAVTLAKLAGVRTIFSAAFDKDVAPRRALSERKRWWLLYAWGLSRTDKIFVQHGGQLSALPRRWQSKARILPGIAPLVESMRPHPERTKNVAWVAVLRQPKRPDVLIEIARKAPTLSFIVCGGPSIHRSLSGYSARIEDALRTLPNVEYRGPVAPEKAYQVIADAGVLLSTSDEEGFPSTFLEAWSSGTPVVSLKIDPDSIIKRIGLGAVSGNEEAAILDINALIASPHRREEIAVRARRYIAETHSAPVVAKAFEHSIQGGYS